MLGEGFELLVGVPASAEYCALRVAAGLSAKSVEAADRGLPNTLFGVVIRRKGVLVGMGRVVGDDGTAYLVVDIAVAPEFQGRGFGKAIVGRLVEHLRETAPVGAYVSLIADGPAEHLYAQFGFKQTAPASVGMAFRIE